MHPSEVQSNKAAKSKEKPKRPSFEFKDSESAEEYFKSLPEDLQSEIRERLIYLLLSKKQGMEEENDIQKT